MPRAVVVVESNIENTFRVSSMRGMYDVPPEKKLRHEWNVDIPIEGKDWNVGLIVGSSGSGKTTIARKLWGNDNVHSEYEWPKSKSILDGFPEKLGTREIVDFLCHVGFSSPPSWAKSFHVLSNGQKFRVELARILAEEKKLIVVDEFTSVIDRNSAKVGSYAVSKTARKTNKQIICLSCHRDIIEWLEPNWVFDTDSMQFTWGLLRRPQINLEIFSVHRSAWRIFRNHHYLTGEISPAAQCFVAFMNAVPVGFTSYVHSAGYFGIKREHRTVVLPDYQGVGIGVVLSDWLGEYLKAKNFRFTSVFSHPALVRARIKSGKWKLLFQGHQISSTTAPTRIDVSSNRLTARMEYVGKKKD